jgi:hypothetical protein
MDACNRHLADKQQPKISELVQNFTSPSPQLAGKFLALGYRIQLVIAKHANRNVIRPINNLTPLRSGNPKLVEASLFRRNQRDTHQPMQCQAGSKSGSGERI